MGTNRSTHPLTLILILSAIFFAVFLMISGALFLRKASMGGSSRVASSSFFGGGGVGILEVNGMIMDSKKTLARLERLEEDERVKAVVVRLNSPGGSTAPSQEIYEAVKAFKKPIVASMSSVAASGAYYIACGAEKIFANPGTLTGSIGARMEFANLQKLYEWAKVQRYSVKAGKFKDIGSEFRPMTPEEHELIQDAVDDILVVFKEAVKASRKMTDREVDAIADGRIFTGRQAKAARLVDELGTLNDAVEEAGRMGKIKGKPVMIYPTREKRSFLDLFTDEGSFEESLDLGVSKNRSALLHFLRSFFEPRGASLSGGEEAGAGLGGGFYWLWNGSTSGG